MANSNIDGFYVGFKPSVSSSLGLTSEQFTYRTVHSLMSSSVAGGIAGHVSTQPKLEFDHNLDSLRKATSYLVLIQAFNSKGAGPSSSEILCSTFSNGEKVFKREYFICLIIRICLEKPSINGGLEFRFQLKCLSLFILN